MRYLTDVFAHLDPGALNLLALSDPIAHIGMGGMGSLARDATRHSSVKAELARERNSRL